MQSNLERLQASELNFITLNLAKQYLRINHAYDDEMIEDMLDTVCVVAENYISRKLKKVTWKMTLHGDLPSRVKLIHGPIKGIDSFKLYKRNGETSYLCGDHYVLGNNEFNMKRNFIIEKAEIIYSVGYEVDDLPSPIKQGMLEHLAKLYDMRGSDQALPIAARSLYQPYRRVRF
jgi:uncharacterized phiE125 gp8 family phage protein